MGYKMKFYNNFNAMFNSVSNGKTVNINNSVEERAYAYVITVPYSSDLDREQTWMVDKMGDETIAWGQEGTDATISIGELVSIVSDVLEKYGLKVKANKTIDEVKEHRTGAVVYDGESFLDRFGSERLAKYYPKLAKKIAMRIEEKAAEKADDRYRNSMLAEREKEARQKSNWNPEWEADFE